MSITKMLTADQVMKMSGDDVGFISADDLANIKSTSELFRRFKKLVLLYLHYKSETDLVGHYCAIVKKPHSICFYDSYGLTPDQILLSKSKKDREATDQQHNYLAKLLYNSGEKIEYNSVQLQSKADRISTCGYHTALALRFSDIPIEIWEQFWRSQKKTHPAPKLDQLVVRMCNLL